MSGSGGNWEGYIFAPNGRAKIQGSSNLSISGSIVADRVTVSGSDFSLNASDLLAGIAAPPSYRLVE